MGLLAPLYFAGALAIALPIVFHLIRRTPTGRQVFSSLMFLEPSPPRLTKRSRLSNILLLLLRAAALALLAFAFARPFLQSADDAEAGIGRGRRVAILLDTSASMQRGDLWQQAIKHVDETLADLKPNDEAALFYFDRQLKPGFTFTEWNELAPAVRLPAMRSRLSEAKPTWAGTQLGEAVSAVADLLVQEEGAKTDADRSGRQLVLISDLQQGGHVEALQGHQWPASVLLQVKSVVPAQPTNAGVQLAEEKSGEAGVDGGDKIRVRVSNQAGATNEQFTLAWANQAGIIKGATPLKVYVPAGRNQVVRVPWPAQATLTIPSTAPATQPTDMNAAVIAAAAPADRLVLQGDDFDFDNTLYIVPPRTQLVRVLFLGDDRPDDLKGLRYYLQGALADTPARKIDFVARKPADALSSADWVDQRLVIVAGALAAEKSAQLKRYIEAGGDVLWVLRDVASSQGIASVLGVDKLDVTEAQLQDFSLISRVDLQHPAFSAFADSRFADFTKIHFWKHRKVTAPANTTAAARTIAWFDNGDPFLLEHSIGKGRLLLATAGWQPDDSQFALSTKFVPFIDGLARSKDGSVLSVTQRVFEPITITAADTARTLVTPDGRRLELAATDRAVSAEKIDRPGVYRLSVGNTETPIAVNLPADESRTAAVGVEELERFGAKVGQAMTAEQLVEQKRQLRTAELESRQKLWRWLILGVLALVAVETIVAGRLARRPALATA